MFVPLFSLTHRSKQLLPTFLQKDELFLSVNNLNVCCMNERILNVCVHRSVIIFVKYRIRNIVAHIYAPTWTSCSQADVPHVLSPAAHLGLLIRVFSWFIWLVRSHSLAPSSDDIIYLRNSVHIPAQNVFMSFHINFHIMSSKQILCFTKL